MIITGLYASLLALIFIGLSAQVIKMRRKYQVGVGDGEQPELVKAIRVHGNFAEYMPLAILLLGLYEFNQGQAWLVHLLGATLVLGRILHAMGLNKTIGTSPHRFIGMMSMFLVILCLAVVNILTFFN